MGGLDNDSSDKFYPLASKDGVQSKVHYSKIYDIVFQKFANKSNSPRSLKSA